MPRDTSAYVIDGARWPSVTEILDCAGMTDLSMVPPRILRAAAERGNDLHEWRAAFDDGLVDRDTVPPQSIAVRFRAYLQFIDETGFVVESSEQPVVNRAMGYVGRYDLLGHFPEKPDAQWVVDTKAVAAVTPATRIQLVGYALAINTDKPPQRAALWLRGEAGKDGRLYRWLPYTNREDVSDWIAAVRVARFRMANRIAKLEEEAA